MERKGIAGGCAPEPRGTSAADAGEAFRYAGSLHGMTRGARSHTRPWAKNLPSLSFLRVFCTARHVVGQP